MRLWCCGVRGSTPTPGAAFTRVGGHTACVAIGEPDGPPRLVLDAGTGLRRLSALLHGQPFRGTLLLGHLHWDHMQGLPFFPAGDHPEASVRVLVPAQGRDPRALLTEVMHPPHFPITPGELRGTWSFGDLDEGEQVLEGYRILAREIPHKGGRTFGYRVSDHTGSVAYLPDHSPQSLGPGADGLGELHEAAIELARDADVLIHDAQYTAAELATRGGWGHAASGYAVSLARAARVGRLLLFHHDPERTDDQVDEVVRAAAAGSEIPVAAAVEGAIIDVGG